MLILYETEWFTVLFHPVKSELKLKSFKIIPLISVGKLSHYSDCPDLLYPNQSSTLVEQMRNRF